MKPAEIVHASTEQALRSALLDRSKQGGAWVASVMPFSTEARLFRYAVPSAVPDDFMSSTHSRERGITWRGKFVSYSRAALAREEARGYSADR